jgi:hypothetical protein
MGISRGREPQLFWSSGGISEREDRMTGGGVDITYLSPSQVYTQMTLPPLPVLLGEGAGGEWERERE